MTEELTKAAQAALNACERIVDQEDSHVQFGIDFRALGSSLRSALALRPAAQDTVVRVCPFKDAECGDRPSSWCDTCPKRPAAQTEREAFEAAMREKCGWHDGDFTHGEFGYFYSHAAMTWLGWQARATQPAPQQATPASAPQSLLMRLAGIAAECSDPDTTDALDALIAATQQATPEPDTCRKRPRCGRADPCAWDGDVRDRLTVNLLRQGVGLTKTQIRALISHAVDGTETDPALFHATPEPVGEHAATVAEVHMSRYTLEWNGAPLPEGTKLYTRHAAAPAVPEGFAQEAMTSKWCWWFGDGERFQIVDTESEAHGEAQSYIDDDADSGEERAYSIARVQHPIDALGMDWLALHVAESIAENVCCWCDDNTGAEEPSIMLSPDDSKALGLMVATFLRQRVGVDWWTANQKTVTQHTYVAGSNDALAAAQAKGAAHG